MIAVKDLTMQYPNGKGIFDISFEVGEGQVVGFLGPNGAGKTSTIRCILGFMRGQSGEAFLNGKECFANADENMKEVGYIAGEPAFPDGVTGIEYLKLLIDIRAMSGKDKSAMLQRMQELIEYFELDASGRVKRMSKGMKQKTAIVAAFMHDPKIIILDEPSSGLDPLMQNKFIELVLAEKKKGKTILISSHIFEEVERTCSEVIIIKEGRIVAKDTVKNLKKSQRKVYIVESDGQEEEIAVSYDEIDKFIKNLAKRKITNLSTKELSLESVFMEYYSRDKKEESK